jgi:integrase
MPKSRPQKSPKVPAYRQRSGYDQAIVTLTDAATKRRRDYWLGEYGTPASRERYHRLIAAWEAGGRRHPDPIDAGIERRANDEPVADDGRPTVATVIAAYWRWAQRYYQPNESGTLRVALRMLRHYHGTEAAEDFGPRKLMALREAMIAGDETCDPPRPAWSRGYINQQVQRLRRMFRWAASREMIPASVHQSLDTVEALKRGRTPAREGKKVTPVPRERIDAVRPFVSRQIAAVIDLQLLTGARPGELLSMQPADIEQQPGEDGEPGVWLFRPREHKNRFREIERTIVLGPRAQAVLAPFLDGRHPESFVFSPAEAEAERRAAVNAARKTPLSCGNRVGTNRSLEPKRSVGDRYTTSSYYVAIRRACDRAFPPLPPLGPREGETNAAWTARLTPKQKDELKVWRKAHRWHPHQLRHNAATEIRRAFGLEAAQLALGHSSAQVTDAVYAERDGSKVAEIMLRVG